MIAIIQFKNFFTHILLSKNIWIKIHKTVALPVVLYECETWSLNLTEHRLREQDLRYERSNEGGRQGQGLRKLYNGELGDFVLVTGYH
jgi:hypothetical protein